MPTLNMTLEELKQKVASRVADLLAGGPGSGCQGPKCGRPAKGGGGKRFVKQQVQSPKGFTYTVLNPVKRGRPQGISKGARMKVSNKSDRLKGRYSKFADVKPVGQPKQKVTLYDASNYAGAGQKTPDPGSGKTIWVKKDMAKKTVEVVEFRRGKYGHIETGTTVRQFKNIGVASGHLAQKYGITERLKRGR